MILVLELEVHSKVFILIHLKYSHHAIVSHTLTSHAVSKMAVAVSMFRWLDLLEKEFDKTFVDLDILLGEIDPDQSEITYDGRQKMTQLSSTFAQLVHKAQTIFQGNAKLEVSLKINFKTSLRVERITCWLAFKVKKEHSDIFILVTFIHLISNIEVAEHRHLSEMFVQV